MKTLASFICMACLIALSFSSCASSSKFIKQSAGQRGTLFISESVDKATMVKAIKYGFTKMNITVEAEKAIGNMTVQLYGKLGSSMQGWGQNIKVTITEEDGTTEASYYSVPRVKMNITEDLGAISNNLHTHVTLYLEAAKEGIDLNEM